MRTFQRRDPMLRSLIETGDVDGVRARLNTVYGQGPRSWRCPGQALLVSLRAVLRRGMRRRTCQAAFVQVSRRQDVAMLDVVAPHLATRRPVPGTWGVRTPLEVAAGDGFLAGVMRLLPVSDPSQGLVLSWAAQHGHRVIVRHLIAPGVAPGITLGHRIKAAQEAAREGHLPVLNDLLDQIRTEGLSSHAFELLTAPLLKGHLACLERLLPLFPLDVRTTDRHGNTPLMLAAQFGQNACLVRLLGVPGSDPTLCNNAGQTLLMLAAQQGHVATLRTLLNVGDPLVEAHRTDHRGRTALMLAAGSGLGSRTIDVLRTLQPYSDATQRDSDGRTAFALAWNTLGMEDPPEDMWLRLDLLAFTEPDAGLVAEVFHRAGAQRMRQWAAHLERRSLQDDLDAAVQASPRACAPNDPPIALPDQHVPRRRL